MKKALPVVLAVIAAASLQLVVPDVSFALAPLPSALQRSGMVDKPGAANKSNTVAVRAIVQAGNLVWVGGVFDQIDGPGGSEVAAASNLAAFDASTGLLATVHIPTVTATQGQAEVYDMSLGPDGKLYLAGHFDAVDGQARQGAAAIDPASGAVLPFAPNAGTAHAILATATAIYVGGTRLLAFHLDGSRPRGYVPPLVQTTGSLRTEMTSPQFRDIAKLGTTIVAACQCDSLVDANGTHPVKAVVELDAATGALLNWVPAGLSREQPRQRPQRDRPRVPRYDRPDRLPRGGRQRLHGRVRLHHRRAALDRGHLGLQSGRDLVPRLPGGGGPLRLDAGAGRPEVRHERLTQPRLPVHAEARGAGRLHGGDPARPERTPLEPGHLLPVQRRVGAAPGTDGSSLNVGGEFTESGGSWSCKRSWAPCLTGSSTQKFFARFMPPPPPGS